MNNNQQPRSPKEHLSRLAGEFNKELFNEAVALLEHEHSDSFWSKFASWYPSRLQSWPKDSQIHMHWTPSELTHFFTTVRLNPYVVACDLEMPSGLVLTELLTGVHKGLIVICWYAIGQDQILADLPNSFQSEKTAGCSTAWLLLNRRNISGNSIEKNNLRGRVRNCMRRFGINNIERYFLQSNSKESSAIH